MKTYISIDRCSNVVVNGLTLPEEFPEKWVRSPDKKLTFLNCRSLGGRSSTLIQSDSLVSVIEANRRQRFLDKAELPMIRQRISYRINTECYKSSSIKAA